MLRFQKLKKIEKDIIDTKKEIRNRFLPENLGINSELYPFFDIRSEKVSNCELDEFETKRRFLLDRRESWLPKTLWNFLVPIVVTVSTTYLLHLFTK